ncbi:protein ecdysoneless-like isoform X1 [Macrosteles quadrilineatus]|uniref:protein ecdysoneless-like isoform X1 n=2 Tax=Macrosteles quadrilineatus TaxID=74068 RepID=UPI0023E31889|nr:protein ecdysoneless-like isoform X1 [Macrosteles quadrilineatus]
MNINKEVLQTVREDDYVEYYIFPKTSHSTENIREYLQNVLAEVRSVFEKYKYCTYIWQKDEVNLVPRFECEIAAVDTSVEKLPPHLYGVTHYGDNIEDEWFIVFLLIKATQEIPGLIARMVDVDGEFLLIEAADHLPKWANPETCDKRVYLHGGSVHLIPGDATLEVDEAIQTIWDTPEETRASTGIQQAISARIEGYPGRIVDNLHSCNVFVPVGVAALLRARPSLVAPAVTAFCHRDPIDLKACRAMRYFPPEHCVMTRVTFTKCLYAMLTHQKYMPDRRTGWNLPLTTDASYASKLLGLKLACGFEILVTQSKSIGQTDDLSKEWQSYKDSLKNKGYFKDLLEGSQEYSRLEEEAKEYFRSHCVQSQPAIGQIVLDLLREIDVDIEELRKNESTLPPSDDDSWLDVSPAELDRMMEQRYGRKLSHPATDIPAQLAQFLNHVSSVDGAEFPQDSLAMDSPPVRPRRGVKPRKANSATTSTSREKESEEDNRVSFDPDSFSCAVQNILDFAVPEDNWDMESDGSGMSSYEDEEDMDLGNKTGDQQETPISELKQYMDQMDRELATTAVGKSFEKIQATDKKGMEDSFSEVESFEPVNIDMNALKNILASYQAQMGVAGPASTMLGPMGVKLDDDDQ